MLDLKYQNLGEAEVEKARFMKQKKIIFKTFRSFGFFRTPIQIVAASDKKKWVYKVIKNDRNFLKPFFETIKFFEFCVILNHCFISFKKVSKIQPFLFLINYGCDWLLFLLKVWCFYNF